MAKGRAVGGGFLFITTIIVIGISGYFYMTEKRFIDNSMSKTARISSIENEPRKRVLYIHALDGGLSGSTLLVTVPFWDKGKIGELIRVRIGTGSGSPIIVDRFFYLHLVSMSILAGYVTLLGIISPLYFFNKRDDCS